LLEFWLVAVVPPEVPEPEEPPVPLSGTPTVPVAVEPEVVALEVAFDEADVAMVVEEEFWA